MKRQPIRVEPFSTYLERRRKGPIYPVVIAGDFVYFHRSILRRVKSGACPSPGRPNWC